MLKEYKAGIYKITNILNGKVYIGQSRDVENRITYHRSVLKHNQHHNQYLQSSYNNNPDSFTFEIVDIVVFEQSLDNLERFWIKFYNSTNREFGYNKESGGCFNKIVSEETRLKMSKSSKGKKKSEKHKEKLSKAKKGKKLSEEHKQNLSKNSSAAKKVINTLTGEVFASVTIAAKAINMNYGTLRNQLNGLKNKLPLKYLEKE